MGTMQDVGEYFKGDDIPDVHPFQNVPKQNTYFENNNKSGSCEEPFGYKNGETNNNSKDYDKLKKKKEK